jgi:hypothetical protein
MKVEKVLVRRRNTNKLPDGPPGLRQRLGARGTFEFVGSAGGVVRLHASHPVVRPWSVVGE